VSWRRLMVGGRRTIPGESMASGLVPGAEPFADRDFFPQSDSIVGAGRDQGGHARIAM
jgi:hypothetical protein